MDCEMFRGEIKYINICDRNCVTVSLVAFLQLDTLSIDFSYKYQTIDKGYFSFSLCKHALLEGRAHVMLINITGRSTMDLLFLHNKNVNRSDFVFPGGFDSWIQIYYVFV